MFFRPERVVEVVLVGRQLGLLLDELVDAVAAEFLQFGVQIADRAAGLRRQRLGAAGLRLVLLIPGVLATAEVRVGDDHRHLAEHLLHRFEEFEERLGVLGGAALVARQFGDALCDVLVRRLPLVVGRVDAVEVPLVLLVDVAPLGNRTHVGYCDARAAGKPYQSTGEAGTRRAAASRLVSGRSRFSDLRTVPD